MSALTQLIITITLLAIASYFFGGIHFASIIARIKGIDITKQGSGNPGTMNMLRTFGVKTAIITLILDALKGAIPAIVGYFLLYNNEILDGVSTNAPAWLGYYMTGGSKIGFFIGGLSVIIGHIFPLISRFKGGKGVASSVGIFMAANPILAVIAFLMAFFYLFFFKYGSVASFIFIFFMTVLEITLSIIFGDSIAVTVLILAICLLIVWAHRTNIKRLFLGTEGDLNIRRQLKKKQEGKLL